MQARRSRRYDNTKKLNRVAVGSITAVKPYVRHARNHNKHAIEKIKKVIAHYEQIVPVIADPSNMIIDGHAVWQSMTELGSGDIAVVVVAGR